ncbi:MAG TPA: response regulator [bacterium]|nr:response regulator [bacterium]
MTQSILAVDDELHMLKLLERIIKEKTPYQIQITNNSLEVPKILEQKKFDLIITDLKMPGLDGMDLLRLIRDQGREEEVIIITAFGSLESAIEALSRGVFDYITKPFKKEQIIFTVDRVMRYQRSRREVARLAAIFETEPFRAAQGVFELEYANRLEKRHDGNQKEMAEKSGLSPERIAEILNRGGREV